MPFPAQEEFHRQMLQKLALHLAAQPDETSQEAGTDIAKQRDTVIKLLWDFTRGCRG
jgi:hypothetical protein